MRIIKKQCDKVTWNTTSKRAQVQLTELYIQIYIDIVLIHISTHEQVVLIQIHKFMVAID